jgi:hypothetical protein
MKPLLSLVSAAALVFSGCIQQIAISTVGGIVHDGFEALTEEQDLEFAEKALPANIKLLEVMLKSDPDNPELLTLISQGYSSYALGFVEDIDAARARVFYLRARDYALRILRKDHLLAKALDGSIDDLKLELKRLDKDDVPAVFWTAFAWGSYINLSLSSPDALADLPRAEAMMTFVARVDSTFYYGGADVFLGTLAGSRPKIFGGDAEQSRRHFERALRINNGKFLMTYVYYARSYAVQTLDEALFEDLLTKVDQASIDIFPEFRLANAIAKRKAHLLLARRGDLF